MKQTTAQLNWPQNGVMQSVDAPLIGYVATDLTITVPCSAAAGLAGPQNRGRTVLLSTVPKQAPKAIDRGLLIERVNNDLLVIVRNTPVVSAPLDQVLSPACQRLTFTAQADKVTGEFVGLVRGPSNDPDDDPGEPLARRTQRVRLPAADRRRLHRSVRSGTARPGVLRDAGHPLQQFADAAQAAGDDRRRGDDARRARRPACVWTPPTADGSNASCRRGGGRAKPLDGVVTAVLVWWHFVGANTADDGYILTMARVSEHAGYMANYYRWFGTPEAPFGWYYDLLALWAHVSTTSAWMRLPTLVMALACWWVISREVLPRLGQAVKTSQAAAWTAAGLFLAFWLPLNNGLRPEPIIALGILLTWCSVERGVATSRLLPVAIAIIIGALTLFSGPTGIAAVGALLVAVGPLKTIVAAHTSRFGYLALLAPILAACTVTIILIFRDQTLIGELQASTFKSAVGPSLSWFDEHIRYERLFTTSPDGSVARRFAVLTLLLALAVSVAMSLRKYRIPGTALGPEPPHHRHHGHLVPGDDVHPHQVDPSLRCVRRVGRIAGRAGRGRRHRGRHALAPQPLGVRRDGAVRDGAVVRDRQRLVVRLELRCAVVEPVPRMEVRLHHHVARAFRRGTAPRGVVPFLRARRIARRARQGAGSVLSSRRWRLPRGCSSCSRCFR